MKQQTWEEQFDDMVAEYAVDFYMQNTSESFDGHWLREEHVSKMVKAELQRQREEMEKMVFEAIEKTKCNLLELKSFEFYPSESGYEIGPGIKKPVKMETVSIDKYEWARIFNSSLDHLKKYLSDDIIKKVEHDNGNQ